MAKSRMLTGRIILVSMITISVSMILSCGNGSISQRAREVQDSTNKADSMAKNFIEVESWDLLNQAIENENGFAAKYGNKKLRIKNLVVDNIAKSGFELQCFAYSPKDSIISNTSQKGNAADKVAEIRDFIQDVPCKINSDFAYFFMLGCKDSQDTAVVKIRKTEETKLSKKNYFRTVITIEGESISYKDNMFALSNCSIISKE